MSRSLALARAAVNPNVAVEIAESGEDVPLPEVVAGVPAPERERALTLAVEVDPPQPHSRWRFWVFWVLVKLAARVYPFRFEIYRTRYPWE